MMLDGAGKVILRIGYLEGASVPGEI
jgi:hypothetical protein